MVLAGRPGPSRRRLDLQAKPPLTADSVFHAQQAAEKSIKGFLSWHDRPFRKTHNLVEIGEQAAAIAVPAGRAKASLAKDMSPPGFMKKL